MANTFLHSGLDGFFSDEIAQPVVTGYNLGNLDGATLAAMAAGTIDTHPNGPTYGGMLGNEGLGDVFAITLTAGQTYTWSYRGTEEGGIEDPYLILFGPGGTYITEDDDGGYDRSSQITYTATTTGTYYLYASSWYQLAGQSYDDTGNYTITQWSPDAAADAPNSLATTFTLGLGTNYAYIDAPGDRDVYAFHVEAGRLYSFSYSGGVSGSGDYDGEAGENIAYLDLFGANGVSLGTNLNYESGLTYFAETDGTIYVRARAFDGTGGYTIDVAEVNPADYDPLEALNWDSAGNIPTVMVDGVPTAYVYFAAAGENFGQLDPSGASMETYGWEQHQIDAVMHALNNGYTPITGINYVVTTDVEQATFRMLTTINQAYGARFFPQDPAYGDDAGIGVFNLISGGFGSDPASLQPGGFSYGVILHEFGHAHGVAHPHDRGGGSEVMLGVTASTGSLGIYDLNQGVYTVMSYNDAWVTHPNGERDYSAATRGSGWSETLGAFDIAVLQERYGVHAANTGNSVYTLTDNQADATYITIWDSAGTDEIRYDGVLDTRIDLLAATLDYTPTGGGVVSFVDGVYGGYTIANGVVIENATGGSGNDVILGNSAANTLTGRQGNDVLLGREGDDTLLGENGNDQLHGNEGNDLLLGANGSDVLFGDDGNDRLEGGNATDELHGGAGNDTLLGGNAADILFGDAGDDRLDGGDGPDVLNGGAGNDTIRTGLGPDIVVFDSIGNGVDRILDYNRSQDSIHIEGNGVITWSDSAAGAQLFVDGQLTAIFEGLTARAMASETNTPMAALNLAEVMHMGASEFFI